MKVQNADTLHLALSHFHNIEHTTAPCADLMGLYLLKGDCMTENTKTNSTAADPAAASPLTVKEAAAVKLNKRVGNTTYRVTLHFKEDAAETMSDKIKRLIRMECV